MIITEVEGEITLLPRHELTPRQRFVNYMLTYLGNDLNRGTDVEQHTAAVLRIAADAVTHGYEAELVALVRGWRVEREREEGSAP